MKRRIAAYVLAALFVFLMPLSLFTRQAEARLFDPQAYKAVLQHSGFYDTMPTILGNMLHDNFSLAASCAENPAWCAESGMLPSEVSACIKSALPLANYLELADEIRLPSEQEYAAFDACVQQHHFDYQQIDTTPLSQFTPQDWETFIAALVPAEAWQQIFEASVDDLFRLLYGQTDRVTLQLTPLQQALNTEQAADALLALLENKPACTPEEIIRWQRYIGGEIDTAPDLCQFPLVLYPQVKPVLQTYLQEYAAALPPTLTLVQTPDAAEMARQVRGFRFALRAAPALPLLFLAAVSLLMIRSLYDWLRWWGLPVFLSGLVGLLLSNVLMLSLNQILLDISHNAESIGLPVEFANGLINTGLGLMQNLSGTLTNLSLALSALGGILLAAAYFLRLRQPSTQP